MTNDKIIEKIAGMSAKELTQLFADIFKKEMAEKGIKIDPAIYWPGALGFSCTNKEEGVIISRLSELKEHDEKRGGGFYYCVDQSRYLPGYKEIKIFF